MSLILDALNRSDPDRRDPDAVPGLQSRHGRESGEPAWRRFLWPALAMLFALLALGLWLGGGKEEAAELPAPPAPEQAAVQVNQPALQPTEAAAPVARAGAAPSQSVAPAPAQSPVKPALDPDVAALYQQAQEPAAPAAESSPVTPAESKEPALDVDAMARAAQAALEQRAGLEEPVVEHAAPFITDLRQSIKDQIPSIFYNEHRWAADPGERSVVLNRKRYSEGQQVKPGLRLVEILPDSIVLDFNGTEFRLQSLNSWVNL